MSETDKPAIINTNKTFLPTITAILELVVQKIPDELYKSIGVIGAPFLAIVINIALKHLFKVYTSNKAIKIYDKWNLRLRAELALSTTTEQRKTDILKEILENETEIKKSEIGSVNIDFE